MLDIGWEILQMGVHAPLLNIHHDPSPLKTAGVCGAARRHPGKVQGASLAHYQYMAYMSLVRTKL